MPIMRRMVAQRRDPMKARQFSVVNTSKPEDLAQPLYDRVNCPTAVPSQLSFFSVQLGGSATLLRAGTSGSVSKTRRDTNLDTSGVVPTKLYQFIGLSLAYIPIQAAVGTAATASIGADILALKYGGYCEFKIIDKPILYLPLHFVPESNPITCVSSTRNNEISVQSGIASAVPFPMYKFGIPITLNPFESFSFDIKFDGSIVLQNIFDIQIALHAFMRRPT